MLGQTNDTLQFSVISDSITIVEQIAEGTKLDKENMSSRSDEFIVETIDHSSHMTIRNGGPGLIATILRRGLASRHMGILWGGFNIQSVVNGTYDAGLIGNTFENVAYLSHDANVITGNASMAGVLDLSQKHSFLSRNRVGINYGSDNNISGVFKSKMSKNAYSQIFSADIKKHANNYRFYNGKTINKQENASIDIVNLNFSNRLLLKNRFLLGSSVWVQKAKRDIPPTKTSVFIAQNQEDENIRISLNGKYYLSSAQKIDFRSAYFKEKIAYTAPGIYSTSDADIYNAALEYSHKSGLAVSSQFRYDYVKASFFEVARTRTTSSLLVAYRGKWKAIKYNLSFRPQLIDSGLFLKTYSINVYKELGETSMLNLHLGQGFTLPSFNDLYWPSGGNENLLTESSVNSEAGWTYKPRTSSLESVKISFFYNLVDNWIQWIPTNGRFEPVNQRKVRNTGFEFDIKYIQKINNNQRVIATMHYAFVDSRLQKHYILPALEGKRTIFVPAHKLSLGLKYKYKKWTVTGLPIYYSRRFDTVDNSTWANGYFVSDLIISWEIPIRDNTIETNISIENITNSNYENISFFPMPLRVFRIGLKYKY